MSVENIIQKNNLQGLSIEEKKSLIQALLQDTPLPRRVKPLPKVYLLKQKCGSYHTKDEYNGLANEHEEEMATLITSNLNGGFKPPPVCKTREANKVAIQKGNGLPKVAVFVQQEAYILPLGLPKEWNKAISNSARSLTRTGKLDKHLPQVKSHLSEIGKKSRAILVSLYPRLKLNRSLCVWRMSDYHALMMHASKAHTAPPCLKKYVKEAFKYYHSGIAKKELNEEIAASVSCLFADYTSPEDILTLETKGYTFGFYIIV
jgi:hypothetical protein